MPPKPKPPKHPNSKKPKKRIQSSRRSTAAREVRSVPAYLSRNLQKVHCMTVTSVPPMVYPKSWTTKHRLTMGNSGLPIYDNNTSEASYFSFNPRTIAMSFPTNMANQFYRVSVRSFKYYAAPFYEDPQSPRHLAIPSGTHTVNVRVDLDKPDTESWLTVYGTTVPRGKLSMTKYQWNLEDATNGWSTNNTTQLVQIFPPRETGIIVQPSHLFDALLESTVCDVVCTFWGGDVDPEIEDYGPQPQPKNEENEDPDLKELLQDMGIQLEDDIKKDHTLVQEISHSEFELIPEL